MTLIIEITSDFICPWCLVAETRLNKAIGEASAERIAQIWYPHELNPTRAFYLSSLSVIKNFRQ